MKRTLFFFPFLMVCVLLCDFDITELSSLDEITVSAYEQMPKDDCEKSKNSDCISSDGNIYIGMSNTKPVEVEVIPIP